MSKTFLSVGATTTESIDSHQTIWVLLPETTMPAVVSTYARQIYPGTKVLLWLGSVRRLFDYHFLPQLKVLDETLRQKRRPEYAAVNAAVEAFAGDLHKRAQIFLSYLSAKRRIDGRLDPVIARIAQQTPLTRKDLRLLLDAVGKTFIAAAAATVAPKEKLEHFIQTGSYDTATILGLALCVDPRFALHLWRDDMAAKSENSSAPVAPDRAALQHELRRAIEKIRNGGACAHDVGGVDLASWLSELIGCAPRQRFFVEAGQCHEGLNKAGCLKFDVSHSFRDFGESAPRFISLDKLSRAVTAFDRALSHLLIRFCKDDPEMKQLTGKHLIHSGLLVRGLLGDNEAMRVLYPLHSTIIPNQPALSEYLVEKTRTAVANGALAQACACHYGLPATQLQRGIERLLTIQRATLPLLPMEVHRLAEAIEARIRLRKATAALDASSGGAHHRQQARQLDISARAQMARQFGLAKTLKADFRVDPSKLFYIDNLLIDRIKALYGHELEFMRRILAGYIERHNAAQPSASAGSGSVVNS